MDTGDTLSVNNSQVFTITDAGKFTGVGSLVNNDTVILNSFNGFQTSLVFNGPRA